LLNSIFNIPIAIEEKQKEIEQINPVAINNGYNVTDLQ
jgi:hypothetical protein